MRAHRIGRPTRLIRMLRWLGYTENEAVVTLLEVRKLERRHRLRVSRAWRLRTHVYREKGFVS